MTLWQPSRALSSLVEALEAEIQEAPESELRYLVRDPMAQSNLLLLRAMVVQAVEAAEKEETGPRAAEGRLTLSRI